MPQRHSTLRASLQYVPCVVDDTPGTLQAPYYTGPMAKEYAFPLDPFQSTAIACLVRTPSSVFACGDCLGMSNPPYSGPSVGVARVVYPAVQPVDQHIAGSAWHPALNQTLAVSGQMFPDFALHSSPLQALAIDTNTVTCCITRVESHSQAHTPCPVLRLASLDRLACNAQISADLPAFEQHTHAAIMHVHLCQPACTGAP